jgi:hypothetical protein
MDSIRGFYNLVENRIKTIKQGVSNCIGTALYIVGEEEYDEGKNIGREEYFSNLNFSKIPRKGCLVVWAEKDKGPFHAGVITDDSPELKISAREENNGLFFKDLSFEKENNSWSGKDVKTIFYIPSKLQKIIGGTNN